MVRGLFSQSEAEDFAGPGEGEVEVVVEPGQTGEDIATTLRDAGVVKSRGAYLEVGGGRPEAGRRIQPGTYVLLKGMTAQDAFDTLADPANRAVNRTTVREGLWASETYARAVEGAPASRSRSTSRPPRTPRRSACPRRPTARSRAGCSPSSYEFPDKSTATQQLKAMVAQTVKVLDEAGVAAKDCQEAAHPRLARRGRGQARRRPPQDRPGAPQPHRDRRRPDYGLLQSDAAVSYGAKRRAPSRARPSSTTRTTPTTPASTPGLPPGPISNPGAASIDAAANPADGPWLFFVAVNPITGETKYATTLAEHERQRRPARTPTATRNRRTAVS